MSTKLHRLPLAAAVGALLAVPAFAQQTQQQGSQQAETAQQSQRQNPQSEQFIKTAVQDDIAEIRIGQLAEKKGTTQTLKNLGQTLAMDHTKALAKTLTLASNMNIVPPLDSTQQAQQEIHKLQLMSGKTFDQALVKYVTQSHQKAIDKFSEAAQTAANNKVQQLAQNELPTLKKHLNMAQQAHQDLQASAAQKLSKNLPLDAQNQEQQ